VHLSRLDEPGRWFFGAQILDRDGQEDPDDVLAEEILVFPQVPDMIQARKMG
jgi:hypothetical protein